MAWRDNEHLALRTVTPIAACYHECIILTPLFMRTQSLTFGFGSMVLAAFLLSIPLSSAHAQTYPMRVSVASDGTQGGAASFLGLTPRAISAAGRYVAFRSIASNLVSNDTNGTGDIFVHDTLTGSTTLESVASDGTQGNGNSSNPSISADGRYVAFVSLANNLVADDANSQVDVFIHDRLSGVTTRASIASDGTQGNGFSSEASLSADGRFVAFHSNASNLVPDDTNASSDVFVHDMLTGSTTLASVASDGTQANNGGGDTSMSFDGRYVAFSSSASNLVPDDTNASFDVFVHDMLTGSTTIASIASDGTYANLGSSDTSLSADGRYVIFISDATNLIAGDTNGVTDVFVRDRVAGTTERVNIASDGTQANGRSRQLADISSDGRYVVFDSAADNLVEGDTIPSSPGLADQFIHDRLTGRTVRVNVDANGNEATAANNGTTHQVISADGRYVAFASNSTNLVPDDTNGANDVFLTPNPFGPAAAPIEMTAVADAFLRNGQQNRNEGANPHLFVQNTGDNRTLVAFNESIIQQFLAVHPTASATLILTIASNGNNWGTTGRTVDAHPLLATFAEGNGKDQGIPNPESTRGTGAGATWNCAADTAIENTAANCSPQWNGGTFGTSTAPSVLHTNGQSGEVAWDVTQDVLNGSFSWLVKKTLENQNGSMEYYSREGAADAGTPSYTPRLLLEP